MPLRKFSSFLVGEAIPLTVVVLELLWVYPWFAWVSKAPFLGWAGAPLSLWSALLLICAAEIFSRYCLNRNWSIAQVQLVVLSSLGVLSLLILRLELGAGYALWDARWIAYISDHLSALIAGFGFAAYLSWQGMSLGRESNLSFNDVYVKFLIGLSALATLLVILGILSFSDPHPAFPPEALYVLAYFCVGLLGLALINLASMQRDILRQDRSGSLFNRQWLSLLLGVVLGIMVVSIGVATIFSFDLAVLVLQPLNVLAGWLFIAVFYAVALPLGFVAAALVYVFRFFAQFLIASQQQQPFKPFTMDELRKAAEGQQTQAIAPEIVVVIKIVLVLIVLSLVILLLARALYRYRKAGPENEVEEINESLWSVDDFKADLRSFLSMLFGWLRRQRKEFNNVAPPESVLEHVEEERIFSLREIYRGLLWEAKLAGLARRIAETPYEYERKLASARQMEAAPLNDITNAYVAERYGLSTTVGAPLEEINRIWRKLRSTFRDQEVAKIR